MYRGVGHRAFIGQIKFDNYYIDAQVKHMLEVQESVQKDN